MPRLKETLVDCLIGFTENEKQEMDLEILRMRLEEKRKLKETVNNEINTVVELF